MNKDQLKVWLDQNAVDFDEKPITYLEVVAQIFDITTYDSEVDRQMGATILEALHSVATRTTFEYQAASNENYLTYLTAVNLRHVRELLEWGTSIRGAWFDAPEGGWDVSKHLSSDPVPELILHTQDQMNNFIINLYALVMEQETDNQRVQVALKDPGTILFREHRGGLAESMETVVTLPATKEALLNHVKEIWKDWFNITDVKWGNIGFDERIGWNTWQVVAYAVEKDPFVVGHINDSIEE